MKTSTWLTMGVLGLLASPCLASQPAPSRDLAGLTIGAALAFPECGVHTTPSLGGYPSFTSYNDTAPDEVCWQRPFGDSHLGEPINPHLERVELNVRAPLPEGISQRVHVTVVNGLVEGIELKTYGQAYQQALLDALSEKYGEPTYAPKKLVQNLMGATFENQEATWTFSDMRVIFLGMTKVGEGLISIRSNALMAEEAQAKRGQPKL